MDLKSIWKRLVGSAVLGGIIILSWSFASVGQVPDVILSVAKAGAPPTVNAGEQVTYDVTVSNTGISPAHNVTLIDTLPPGFTASSITPSAGVTCAGLGTGTVTCDMGTIAAPGVKSVTIVADVPLGTEGGDYTNSAAAGSDETVPTSGTAVTTVVESASLTASKTGPATADAGTSLTYTVDIASTGPSDVDNVAVTDTVSSGLLIVSVGSPDCTIAPDQLSFSCSIAHISASSPVSFTVVADSDSGLADGFLVTNTVTADSDEPGAPPPVAVVTTMANSADLSVSKTDSPDPVAAGDDLTYTITVDNLGPSDALDVEATDTLPPGTTFVSATAPDCSDDGGGTVTCGLADIVAGESISWQITVRVDKVGSTIADGDVLTNHAEISATATPDPVAGNDQADEDTTVTAPDIDLVKTATPESGADLSPGEAVTFVIAYENNGTAPATGVVITDTISSLLGEVMPYDGGVYDPDTHSITWTLTGTIGPAGDPTSTGTVSFTARLGAVSSNQTIRNQALMTVVEYQDQIPSNTTSTRARPPDVLVTKDADRPDGTEIKAFDVITYQIVVRNRAGGNAVGVIVTDAPPPYMSYVPGSTTSGGSQVADSAGTSALFSGGIALGTLSPGRSITITFQMSVDAAAPAGALLENWGYATWNVGSQRSGDFTDLRVLRPRTGPTLRQTILVQSPSGRTIFVTVFNEVIGLLPVTGYGVWLLVLLGFAAWGFGRASAMRIAPDLFRRLQS